jgi:anthranilate phosphoribosyltransferase
VEQGTVRPGCLNPAEYGFEPCREEDLSVDGPARAAEVLRLLLQGEGPKPMRDMLVLNLGMALYILGSEEHRGEFLDPARGYNPPRMAAAMDEAGKAAAAGAGRRFCRA